MIKLDLTSALTVIYVAVCTSFPFIPSRVGVRQWMKEQRAGLFRGAQERFVTTWGEKAGRKW